MSNAFENRLEKLPGVDFSLETVEYFLNAKKKQITL